MILSCVTTWTKNKKELNTEFESGYTIRRSELQEVTLCQLFVFNKRRGGDVARMKINNYERKPYWQIKKIRKCWTL